MAVIKYCVNPPCAKRMRVVSGASNHCTVKCKKEHHKIRHRNVMRIRSVKKYLEDNNKEYKDLPYCKLCGVRTPKIYHHYHYSHPEVDLKHYCWKNKVKLFDMYDRDFIQNLSDRGVDSYNRQIEDINDYLKSLEDGDEDDS